MSDEPRAIQWAHVCAATGLICGLVLVVAGVYVLAGLGWALLAAAAPFLMLSAVIVRGLTSG